MVAEPWSNPGSYRIDPAPLPGAAMATPTNEQIVNELGISQPILEALGAITLNQPHPTQEQAIAALEAIVPAVKNMIQSMYIMAGRVNQSMENSNRLGQEIILSPRSVC